MLTLVLALSLYSGGQTLLTPSQVLERLGESKSVERPKPLADEPPEYTNLRKRIDSFASRADEMAPGDAAKEWVSLLNAYFEPMPQRWDAVEARECLNVLPGPDSWPLIAAELRTQEPPASQSATVTSVKRLLADVLCSDLQAERVDLNSLSTESQKRELSGFVSRVEYGLASWSRDPEWILSAFRNYANNSADGTVGTPNYSQLVGDQRAEKELRQLILNDDGMLYPPEDEAGRRIVERLLPKLIKRLSERPWALIATPSVALQVMPYALKKWPAGGGRESDVHGTAKLMYCVGLQEAGRTKAAARLATELEWDRDYEYLAPVGHDKAMFSIYSGLARRHAALVYWDDFLERVKNSGEAEVGLRVLASAVSSRHNDPAIRDQLSLLYSLALLRSGQVQRGIRQLTQEVAGQMSEPRGDDGYLRHKEAEDQISPSETLARIGAALHNPALLGLGARTLKHLGATVQFDADDPAACLLGVGRVREAQEVALSKDPEIRTNTNNLVFLASIYYHENRPRDLLEFVNRYQAWDVGDISKLDEDIELRFAPRLGFLVAWALAQTGERERSFQVLLPALHGQNVTDAEYDLLLKLKGGRAIQVLNSLARENRFSSDPLLWKGIAFCRFGHLDLAASTLRRAIAIDPWGANRPADCRTRARRALAWVLRKQGLLGQATKLDRQVHALELAESAERLSELGLAELAGSKFRLSLRAEPSCFLTHYHYALCLAGQGLRIRSTTQWRLAFETLPAGIGRGHDRNWGLEDLFGSEIARKAALPALTRFTGSQLENSRASYWLGKLYAKLHKPKKAAQAYWRAAKLDSSYLDAWQELATSVRGTPADPRLAFAACEAVARLAQKGPSFSLEGEIDPSALNMQELGQLCYVAKLNPVDAYVAPKTTYPLTRRPGSTDSPTPFWNARQTSTGSMASRSPVLEDVFLLMERITEHSGP